MAFPEHLNRFEPKLKVRAKRILKELIFGTKCHEPHSHLLDIYLGMSLLSEINRMQRQAYTPCQTSIPTFYSPPLITSSNPIFTLACDADYSFNILDVLHTGQSVVDFTSLRIKTNAAPQHGAATIKSNGRVRFKAIQQSVQKKIWFEIGVKSFYSQTESTIRVNVTLTACTNCNIISAVTAIPNCFTIQVNEI